MHSALCTHPENIVERQPLILIARDGTQRKPASAWLIGPTGKCTRDSILYPYIHACFPHVPQESFEDEHHFVPQLPPQVVVQQPLSLDDGGLSPPHDFIIVTTVLTVILACLSVCSLACTGPALYLAIFVSCSAPIGNVEGGVPNISVRN